MTTSSGRTAVEEFTLDYRITMLRFLPRRDEVALEAGYEQGRRAFAAGVSLLDVCRIHHDLTLEILRDTPAEEFVSVTEATGKLLLEVLGAYDMTHRGVLGP